MWFLDITSAKGFVYISTLNSRETISYPDVNAAVYQKTENQIMASFRLLYSHSIDVSWSAVSHPKSSEYAIYIFINGITISGCYSCSCYLKNADQLSRSVISNKEINRRIFTYGCKLLVLHILLLKQPISKLISSPLIVLILLKFSNAFIW